MEVFDGAQLKQLMDKQQLTIAVAESLTVGNIQAAIGSISGASTFFEGGLTAYNLEQKVKHLGVNREHAEKVNSVSPQVALEMAKGICLKFDCEIGIGTTGYASAYPEEDIPSPYAYFAIWQRNTFGGQLIANELVQGENLGRVGMQHHVTQQVLISLFSYVQSITSAH